MVWVIPDLPPAVWITLIILALIAYSYLSRSPWKRLPPGPPSFPVIGSIPFLGGDIRKVFSKMAAKYGDVFSIRIGSRHVVVLNGYETIKEALLKTPNVYDGRSDMFIGISNKQGLLSSDGKVWKAMRSSVLHILRNFGLGQRSLEMLVQEEVQHLVAELDNICGESCHVNATVRKAVANIIAVIIYGTRYDYEDANFNTYLNDLLRMTELMGANNPALNFPILRRIPGDPFGYHELTSLVVKWNVKFVEEIKARKKILKSGDDDGQDMITLFLKQIPHWKELGDSSFFEGHLPFVISDLLAAGTDTSSNTLLWTILYLMLNPYVQNRLHKEIDDVVGPGRCPVMKDRVNMPYTEAVISEAQRLGDIAPLAIPHATMDDTLLKGYTIPKGTMIIPNLNSVHSDPVLWDAPTKFDPERFLDDDGKYRKREELIPFSLGKHSCLGENLARMELFIFLTTLLQRFTFSVPPDQPKPSTEGVVGITHHPKHFQTVISAR